MKEDNIATKKFVQLWVRLTNTFKYFTQKHPGHDQLTGINLIELLAAFMLHKKWSDKLESLSWESCFAILTDGGVEKPEFHKKNFEDLKKHLFPKNNIESFSSYVRSFKNFFELSEVILDQLRTFEKPHAETYKPTFFETKHKEHKVFRPSLWPEMFSSEIVSILNDFNFSTDEISDYDYLFYWNYFFNQFAVPLNPRGLLGGLNSIPESVKNLISQLLDLDPFERICVPSLGKGGLGGFLLQIAQSFQFYFDEPLTPEEEKEEKFERIMHGETTITGYETNSSIANTLNLIGFALSDIELDIREEDFFLFASEQRSIKKELFDVIISQPTVGISFRSRYPKTIKTNDGQIISRITEELYYIFSALDHLREKGRMAFVLPQKTFTRNNTRIGRKYLCEKDLIEAVIEIPHETYPNAPLPLVIVVLNKGKNIKLKNKILFLKPEAHKLVNENYNIPDKEIDTIVSLYENVKIDKKRSRIVEREDLQFHDFALAPYLYFHDETKELRNLLAHGKARRLQELAKIVIGRPARKTQKKIDKSYIRVPVVGPEHLMRDLANRLLTLPSDDNLIYAPINSVLNHKAILISRFQELKPTIYDPNIIDDNANENISSSKGIFINHSIISIIPDESIIDFDYLYYQLNSSLVQKQLALESTGKTRVSFSANALRRLIIPIFSGKEEQRIFVEEQKRLLLERENARHDAILRELEAAEELIGAEFNMIRALRHELNPRLGDIKIILQTLNDFLEERNLLNEPSQERLFENEKVPLLGENIDKALHSVDHMTKIMELIREVVAQEIDPQDFQSVDLKKFFNKEVKTLGSLDNYKILLKEYKCDEAVKLHKTLFIRAIENIIRNAEKHGFTELGKNYEISFSVEQQENYVVIDYTNDGNKWPDNLSKDDFMTFGNKGKDSVGDGLGGVWVRKFIDVHKGSFDIINDRHHPVHFKITLPKERK